MNSTLYSIWEARIYTCTGVRKYAQNLLYNGETTKGTYPSNTPQTQGGSMTLSLERENLCRILICALVKKSANWNSKGTYWRVLTSSCTYASVCEASTPICLASSCFTGSRAMLIAPVLSDKRGVAPKQKHQNPQAATIFASLVALWGIVGLTGAIGGAQLR